MIAGTAAVGSTPVGLAASIHSYPNSNGILRSAKADAGGKLYLAFVCAATSLFASAVAKYRVELDE